MRVFVLLLTLSLMSCSNAVRWTADSYTVREGDTLFSIARKFDIAPRDLAAWNRLGDGRLIYPGQRLRLYGPNASAPVTSGSTKSRPSIDPAPPPKPVGGWRWPTKGSVAAGFGAGPSTQSGIQIAGRLGQAIRAAAAGEVVYAGSGLKSYGQLIIIKHNDSYLSAYGHNRKIIVKEGDRVRAGQDIAQMGEGPGQRPLLHFEVRQNGRPVNPLRFLPKP